MNFKSLALLRVAIGHVNTTLLKNCNAMMAVDYPFRLGELLVNPAGPVRETASTLRWIV
jgi:hypothetical protein